MARIRSLFLLLTALLLVFLPPSLCSSASPLPCLIILERRLHAASFTWLINHLKSLRNTTVAALDDSPSTPILLRNTQMHWQYACIVIVAPTTSSGMSAADMKAFAAAGHTVMLFGSSPYVSQLAQEWQFDIPACAHDSPRIITPPFLLPSISSAIFPSPSPSLNFSGCLFPAPHPPALILASIEPSSASSPSSSSSSTTTAAAAAAAIQTQDNARISFIADAGACSNVLTSMRHNTAGTIPDAGAADHADFPVEDATSSNTQFCSRLISWSLHSHAHMTASIELSHQEITTGIPFQIHVNVSGTYDALSAASAAGFYAIIRITDAPSPPPLPLVILTPPHAPCSACLVQLSAVFAAPDAPAAAHAIGRTLTVSVRSSATALGHSNLNARLRTLVLPPPPPRPPLAVYLRLALFVVALVAVVALERKLSKLGKGLNNNNNSNNSGTSDKQSQKHE